MSKRVILYVIYEKYGILDEWYEELFKDFTENSSYRICVVNGELNQAGQSVLSKYFNEVIYRENKGYDVTAYREGILYLFGKGIEIDQLVLCNNSFFGPIHPMKTMFNTMENKECDFWGITWGGGTKDIPYHIQSYFFLFKKNVIESKAFTDFVKNMPPVTTYDDAVKFVELRLTGYLHSHGFKSLIYMDTVDKDINRHDQLSLIKNGYPVLKRRKIIYSKRYGYNHGINNQGLLEYIKSHTNFKVEYIYRNLLREFPFEQIDYCLKPYLILDSKAPYTGSTRIKVKKIISCNKRSRSLVNQILNKYSDYIKDIEVIESESGAGVIESFKSEESYDYYSNVSLIYRDFLSEEINFALFEHLFFSIYGSIDYRNMLYDYLENRIHAGTIIPVDYNLGLKINNMVKLEDTAYNILKSQGITTVLSKGINVLSLDSSFIINKKVYNILKQLDLSGSGSGYLSYVIMGRIVRYVTQSQLLMTYKAGSISQAASVITSLSYKVNNYKVEDMVKAWWKTSRIKL